MATTAQQHNSYWPRQPRNLLNHIVDDMAREKPEAIYAELPLSATSFDGGFRRISYRDLSNAINGMAWWLNKTLGPGQNFETLAYIGPTDMRHSILLLGAVKAGFKMLFTSPHNSAQVQVKLMKELDCKTMLVAKLRHPVVNAILDAYEMRLFHIPELKDLLDHDHPYYPYLKTFDEAFGEPLVVVHTSGTIGLPKPITWTHDWAASFAEERYLAPPSGADSMDGLLRRLRLFSLMPPYHMAVDCVEHTRVDIITMIPPDVEAMGPNNEVLRSLSRRVGSVMWAAGDVSFSAGDAISSKLQLFTTFGSTETGLWPIIRRCGQWKSDEWKFIRFHPAMNIRLDHRSDGLFEAIIMRNTKFEYEQPIFKLFPMLQEYGTGDLFAPHPIELDLWQYRGRVDDIQVFLSGKTYHPRLVENYINRHPNMEGALLIGTRRPQAALLLEMRVPECFGLSERIEEVWPTVEEAMHVCPAHAKVTKQHILFVKPEKPMARSEKGIVQRQITVQQYEEELNELFESAAAAASAAAATAPVPPTAP